MLKFLRKYNKFIMVVGGTLLMVVFLLPQAMQQYAPGGPTGTAAYYDGGRITMRELNHAAGEMQLIGNMTSGAMFTALGIEGVEHWILLAHEADRLGLVGGPDDGYASMEDLARDYESLTAGTIMAEPYPVILDRIQNNRNDAIARGTPPNSVDRSLAKFRGIMRMLQLYAGGSRISKAEAVAAGADFFDVAVTDLLIIQADADMSKLPEPISDDQLAAHFSTYRDASPADNQFGISYRRDPGVTLEYIKIDLAAISPLIEVDEIALDAHYRANIATYGADKAAAREAITSGYRREKATELIARAVDAVNRSILRSKAALPQDGERRILPPDWAATRPPLEALAHIAQAELPTGTDADPVVRVYPSDGAFLDRAAIGAIPNLGFATDRPGQPGRSRLADIALNLPEFNPQAPGSYQTGITFGPLYDFIGSAYFVRILDARPAGPPESLDEVRTKALVNAATIANFERLSNPQNIDVLRRIAVAEGLSTLVDRDGGTLVEEANVTTQAIVKAPSHPAVAAINTQPVRDAIMAATKGWPADTIAADQPADARTVAVAVPSAKAVVIAQVKAWRPMTLEQYRQQQQTIARHVGELLVPASLEGHRALSFAALSKRLNYRVPGAAEIAEDAAPVEAPASGG